MGRARRDLGQVATQGARRCGLLVVGASRSRWDLGDSCRHGEDGLCAEEDSRSSVQRVGVDKRQEVGNARF
jgi:hypothetical protein